MPKSTKRWPAISAAAEPTPGSVLPFTMPPRTWPEEHTMQFDSAMAVDLQRVLSHRSTAAVDGSGTLERRSFLKLGAATGFALGVFPLAASAQPASGPKPTGQPAAFVQIDRDGITTVTINRLEFGQGVQTGL